MNGGGDLPVGAAPRSRAFITRSPFPVDLKSDAATPRRRRTDREPADHDDAHAPMRGLLISVLLGLALWVAAIYLVRFIVH